MLEVMIGIMQDKQIQLGGGGAVHKMTQAAAAEARTRNPVLKEKPCLKNNLYIPTYLSVC